MHELLPGEAMTIRRDPAMVALIADQQGVSYPLPPYSPHELFPEYSWRRDAIGSSQSNASTDVYGMVRTAFFLLGLDREHFGTASWNPLSAIITPGDSVLIKPNLVFDTNNSGCGPECLVTHGSVVRAVADYAALAMGNKGRLLLGDAPVQACSFDTALKISGMDDVVEYLRGHGISMGVQDFRNTAVKEGPLGVPSRLGHRSHSNDGCIEVPVDSLSALSPLDAHVDKYRVTRYDPDAMSKYHRAGVHKYLVSASALASDAIISIAKMKTHKKAGVTGALKNSVGITADKECLPHHRAGSPSESGDEYRRKNWSKRMCSHMLDRENRTEGRLGRLMLHFGARASWAGARLLGVDTTWEGSWPGNDTLWRTVLDLNRILIYADKKGRLMREPQRKVLFLVDGIVAGEGEGPLSPLPRPTGIIIAGFWAPTVDAVMATVMGLDWKQIPVISHALKARDALGIEVDAKNITVVSNKDSLNGPLTLKHKMFSFVPPRHWESIRVPEEHRP